MKMTESQKLECKIKREFFMEIVQTFNSNDKAAIINKMCIRDRLQNIHLLSEATKRRRQAKQNITLLHFGLYAAVKRSFDCLLYTSINHILLVCLRQIPFPDAVYQLTGSRRQILNIQMRFSVKVPADHRLNLIPVSYTHLTSCPSAQRKTPPKIPCSSLYNQISSYTPPDKNCLNQ